VKEIKVNIITIIHQLILLISEVLVRQARKLVFQSGLIKSGEPYV